MNSDTAPTQWGQEEEVLLIEPDRGEDREEAVRDGQRRKRSSERRCEEARERHVTLPAVKGRGRQQTTDKWLQEPLQMGSIPRIECFRSPKEKPSKRC